MHFLRVLSILAAILFAAKTFAHDHESAIHAALESYKKALNSGDAAKVVALFTDDIVLMRTNQMPVVGLDAAQAAYSANFANLKIESDFEVQEILKFSDDYAMLRTIGTGKATILKSGMTVQGKNNEVFVLHKQSDGAWKIARYIFSPAAPMPAPPRPPAK